MAPPCPKAKLPKSEEGADPLPLPADAPPFWVDPLADDTPAPAALVDPAGMTPLTATPSPAPKAELPNVVATDPPTPEPIAAPPSAELASPTPLPEAIPPLTAPVPAPAAFEIPRLEAENQMTWTSKWNLNEKTALRKRAGLAGVAGEDEFSGLVVVALTDRADGEEFCGLRVVALTDRADAEEFCGLTVVVLTDGVAGMAMEDATMAKRIITAWNRFHESFSHWKVTKCLPGSCWCWKTVVRTWRR
jgi:hypothetical protein